MYSRTIPHDHEVVHAVRDAAEGTPLAIEEGAASYWGGLQGEGDGAGSGADVRLLDALAAGDEGRMTLADYERVGHFTSYLVHEWGPEANAMLLRETSTNTTRAVLDDAFARTFGESLATATASYTATWPWCSREAVRSSFFDCAGPGIRLCEGPVDDYPLVDLAFEVSWWLDHALELDVSCADDGAVGPSRGRIWRDVVVDVPVGGVYALGGVIEDGRDGHGDSTITIKRCDTECALAEPIEVPITTSGALVTDVDLQPGRHVLHVELREEIAGRIAIGWGCPSN